MSSEIPWRSCCGQQHRGPVCPDGLVMCCACFRRVPRDRLAILDDGDGHSVESAPVYVDMCRTCKRREELWCERQDALDERRISPEKQDSE